jgi:NifU-like protein
MTTPVLSAPVLARLAALRYAGELTSTDAVAHGCTLLRAEHGAEVAPDRIVLTLLTDSGGLVHDARFASPATGELRAAYDVMCQLIIGRLLIDAAMVSPRQVDDYLRQGALSTALTLSLDADTPFYVLGKAAQQVTAAAKPVALIAGLPWTEIGLFEKVRRIEQVLDVHVRPALASDGGGMDLVDLKEDQLFVQYQGACGSCSSSIGGTLQFVQDSLNNHLATSLKVQVTSVEEASPFPV